MIPNEILSRMMNTEHRKQLLFKYLDITGAVAMLAHSDLQFTNATKLNDPFDCHPGLIDFSKIPPERAIWGREDSILLESDPYRRNREEAWICSLSKIHDSILMWSYYNGHKGVCIGLDAEKVKAHLRPEYGLMVDNSCYEIEYLDVVEKPDYFAGRNNFFYYQMLTKAKDWAHEQEVRMFIMNPSSQIMVLKYKSKKDSPKEHEVTDWKEVRAYPSIGAECFASIYLGINISEKHKKGIIKYARKANPDIKIYQMTINPDAFKLDYFKII